MAISFNKLDLNLLRVFDAIMEERNVLRAGQRLCLSQSATSHALARLREMLDDDLFIRTPTGMQPTVRALAMAPRIREAWKSLEAAIELPKFDPNNSTRRFTIAASDFATAVMVPGLLRLLRCEAPLVDLVVRPNNWIDLTGQIDLGQIDVAIGTFSSVPARFKSGSLFAYDDVLIASSSLELGKLSLEKLLGLSIATVSLHGEHDGIADGYVSERGLVRRSEVYDRNSMEQAYSGSGRRPRIAVSLPHFLALPSLLEDMHLTAIVPRPLAKSLVRMHPLSIYELPYVTTAVNASAVWHERSGGDAPQEWLREMLRRATEPLRECSVEFDCQIRSTSIALPPRTAAESKC